MIELLPFNESDFGELIAEIPDARFLLQWAGPKYTHPLDAAQLNETLADTVGGKPAFRVCKAVKTGTPETVGHIQLMNIDYNAASCVLGRVLAYQQYRGNGYGKAMVEKAVRLAFENLHLEEVSLNVFDFNMRAIGIYRSIGFTEFQIDKSARYLQNKSWNVVKMKLSRKGWFQRNTGKC